jgi:Tol biopolymer transport system component
MGEVFRARDTRIGREVAVKVLPAEFAQSPDRLRRFEQEARAAGMLQHPNLLTVFDVGTVPAPYVVTELLDGETLRAKIGDRPIALQKALDYARQTAAGLAAAHDKGIVHRDLKPENIFITRGGAVKILDFGLAKLTEPRSDPAALSAAPTAARLTEPGTILGTAGYMAPEQIRGAAVDHRADIFAFGAILHEMLSGRRTFRGATSADTMSAVLREEPAQLEGVPPALERIVRHCLEKEPEQRFQSARDLLFDLEAAGQTSAPPKQRTLPGVIVPLLALAIGIAAGVLIGRRDEPPPSVAPPTLQLLTFSGRDSAPALSPDGRTMAFTSARDGHLRIWIKDLARGGEAPLTSGEDGWARFSPDGSSILFLRRAGDTRALFVTAVLGGTARRVRDDVSAADWSRDSRRIVFTSTLSGGKTILGSINADGSGESVIRELPGIFVAPRVSPDGSQIAITEFASSSLATSIILVSADGRSARPLPLGRYAKAGLSAVAWTASDRLITGALAQATPFTNTGTDIVEIDTRTGEVNPRVHVPATVVITDVTGDGRVAFDTQVIRQNLRDGDRWITRGNVVARQPTCAPDGKSVIFSSNQGGNLDIWSVSRESGEQVRLTDDPADDFDPALTPDGRHLIWTTNRGGHFEIWIANADGSGPRQLTRDGADAENATATGDGWVIYNSYHPQKSGVWRVRVDGSEAAQIVRGVTEIPEVSPDGRWVSYHLISPRSELRVTRIADGETFKIADVRGRIGQAAPGVGRSRWTPSGDALAWTDIDQSDTWGVLTQKFVPGRDTSATRRPLAGFGGEHVESFSFSPDGSRLIVSVLDQTDAIYMAAWEK